MGKVQTVTCTVCEQDHPVTLVNEAGVCVYCRVGKSGEEAKAKAAEQTAEAVAERRIAEEKARRRRMYAEQRAAQKKVAERQAAKAKQTESFDAAEAAKAELARRQLAREHLLPMVLRTNPDYLPGWVHKDICEHLEWFSAAVAAGESPRLMLFVPPRHGKSEIASRIFPAWHLGRNPRHEVIACSYAGSLANDFSRKVRGLFRDPSFQTVFPESALAKDSQSVEQWSTAQGGGYVAAGVGGPITGRGAHCVSSHLSVTTRRGTIPANQVAVGEEVLGYDHDTGRAVWTSVRAVSTTRKPELVRIGSLVCTPDHRVWTDLRGYVQAAQVQPEDDLVGVRTLWHGVRADAQGAPARTAAQGQSEQPAEDVLFPSLRTRRAGDWRQEDLSMLRWGEGTAREDVQRLLRGGTGDTHGASGVPPVRDGVRPAARGVGEVEDPAWAARQGVLQPGLLPGVSAREPVCEQAAKGRVPELRGADLSAQAAEVLLPQMLHGLPEEAGEPELHGVPGRVAPATVGGPAPGSHMPAVREVRSTGGASHRPRCDEQRTDQPDRPVPDVPLLVSCEPGVCAGDLEAGLHGPGFDVVDLQTDTSNFFAGETLVHNCLIIDDPLKNREDAESESTRQSIWDWYTSTAYTRLAPGGGVILIQTRWHDDDLGGRLLQAHERGEGDEWRVVRYPAIAEYDELFRNQGEALHPDRYPISALERIKRTVGPRDWSALYQQNPVADDGDYFKKDDFQWYKREELPPLEEMNFYTAWDLAIGQKEQNDFTVGITVGVDRKDNIWVVDIRRGRWGSLEIIEKMIEMQRTWQSKLVGIERGHILMTMGPILEKRLRETRTMMPIQELRPGKQDKIARARPIQARMQQKRVFFRQGCDVTLALVAEMMRFPNGVHDDQCLVAGTRVSVSGGTAPIERLKVGDSVLTPAGPRTVVDAQCTGEAPIYRLETEAGQVIEGSGSHPIYTHNRGFVRMDKIEWYDELITESLPCLELKPKRSTVSFFGGTLARPIGRIASIGRLIRPTKTRSSTCTDTYGNERTALSRAGTTSITGMRTRSIMLSRTLSACRPPNTASATSRHSFSERLATSSFITSTLFAPWLLLGTALRRVWPGIPRTASALGRTGNGSTSAANPAVATIEPHSPTAPAIAPRPVAIASGSAPTSAPHAISGLGHQSSGSASTVALSTSPSSEPSGVSAQLRAGTLTLTRVARVVKTDRVEPVFNITVAGEHVYFAEGVLTHNCDSMAWVGQMLTLYTSTREKKAPRQPSWRDKLTRTIRSANTRTAMTS